MKENGVAKILQIIGIAEVICGIILGIIILSNESDFNWIGIAVIIMSFITCMIFIGFSEIIKLLQKGAETQEQVLSFLKDNTNKEKMAPKSVLQDIESNLPEM